MMARQLMSTDQHLTRLLTRAVPRRKLFVPSRSNQSTLGESRGRKATGPRLLRDAVLRHDVTKDARPPSCRKVRSASAFLSHTSAAGGRLPSAVRRKGRTMRGITRTWVLAVAAVCIGAPAWAQTELLVGAEPVQLPAKGRIAVRDGNVQMSFKVYDRAAGGRLVYQEAQSVAVSAGVYFAMVGSKARQGAALNSERALWVEATAGGRAVGERQAFRLLREGDFDAGTMTHAQHGFAGLCFTCGGFFPIFTGSFTPVNNNPTEYGSSCSGSSPVTRTDSRPFVCSRRMFQ
jgi:hypothetical protein